MLGLAVLLGLLLVVYLTTFGSNDVEESTHMSYSAGASLHIDLGSESGRKSGVRSVLGIPIFDTIQGTGDRLPYQASWAQSVTWPFRFFVSWEHLSALRTFVFGTAGIWLALTAFGSWLLRRSYIRMTVLGGLLVSSFGLYVRHNEWSDTYTQTIGVIGICAFLMHRCFNQPTCEQRFFLPRASLLAIFVAVNGVITGHPGFWPIALFSWSAILIALGMQKSYWRTMKSFFEAQLKFVAAAGAATVFTVIAVVIDLFGELDGKASGRPLSRTQGLFSEHVFVGVYGLSEGGVLPETLRKLVSSILATFLLPAFMLFDPALPQMIRASEFKEIVRVEFTGSLILVVLLFASRQLVDESLRSFIRRIVVAQSLIWVVVALASRDLLPSGLAPSGAWFFGPVLLAINVFLTFLILDRAGSGRRLVRLPAYFNLVLVVFWCLVQFGAASFGPRLSLPERYASWFQGSKHLSDSRMFSDELRDSERMVLLPLGHWTNYLYFSALQIPVVIPADPKIRDAGQLMPNAAFNNSLMWQAVPAEVDPIVRDRVFDFLSVENVVVGFSDEDPVLERQIRRSENAVIRNLRSSYKVVHRSDFSVFTLPKSSKSQVETCPVLTFRTSCAVVFDSDRTATVSEPRLRSCDSGCLWTFRTPDISESDVLIVPVTYDSTLVVRDDRGRKVETETVGGFLGVSRDNGVPEGELRIDLAPDVRMWLRVLASYANLLVVAAVAASLLASARRARRALTSRAVNLQP